MAVEEVIKDEYSDENFMVGDNSKAAALGEDENVQVGDAFENTKADSFEVRYYQNKRLAGEAVNLKKENEQLKLDNAKYKIDLEGKALPKIDEKPKLDIDTSSLSSFATSVGDSFMNIASGDRDWEKNLKKMYLYLI